MNMETNIVRKSEGDNKIKDIRC